MRPLWLTTSTRPVLTSTGKRVLATTRLTATSSRPSILQTSEALHASAECQG